MSFFGLNFGQSAEIDIILDNQDERKMAELKDENGRKQRYYLFYDGESVTGKVNVTLHRRTNKLEHQGIKIEFIGQIELYYDRGNHHEFLSLVKGLARPGELTQNTSFDFEFNQVEKPYECYTGANVRLRYFLRVTIVRRITDMTKEMDILVHTLASYPEMNNPIKMEVGIEECLHIEFEYNKSKYHLKDVIVGKIYFLLVRIKIKHMEIAIIKRETTGSGPNTFHDNETIAKYEIMDGAPVKGESIPIRVFLAGYDLTPTMRDINKKFSVGYLLNLVLVDEEERRYFKQQEITLWRKGERVRKTQLQTSYSGHQIPHAMARHIPADRDQPVRTAPTPSDPTTPVDPSFSSAAAAAAATAPATAAASTTAAAAAAAAAAAPMTNNPLAATPPTADPTTTTIPSQQLQQQQEEKVVHNEAVKGKEAAVNNVDNNEEEEEEEEEEEGSEPEVIEKAEVETVGAEKKEEDPSLASSSSSSSKKEEEEEPGNNLSKHSSSSSPPPHHHPSSSSQQQNLIESDEDDGKPKPPEDFSVPPDSRESSPDIPETPPDTPPDLRDLPPDIRDNDL